MNRYQEKRAVKNDESKKTAENYNEAWSGDELDELCKNWDGTDATLEVIAFVLGRTIESCRQRYYVHVHEDTGAMRIPVDRKRGDVIPTFRPGWLFAQCSSCGRTTDVYMDHSGTKTCEDHEEVDA